MRMAEEENVPEDPEELEDDPDEEDPEDELPPARPPPPPPPPPFLRSRAFRCTSVDSLKGRASRKDSALSSSGIAKPAAVDAPKTEQTKNVENFMPVVPQIPDENVVVDFCSKGRSAVVGSQDT